MHVSQLMLRDFRSYEAAEVSLAPGTTVFVGRNGNGKTNLVEAIGYLATLGSHRAGTDAPLVRSGAPYAAVGARVERERSVSLQVQITPGRSNRAWVNRSPTSRARDLLGLLRVVVFAPEDLALVKGDPSNRRRYLDDLLVQRTPRLAGTRSEYERVLRQRTALLRQMQRPGRRDRPTDEDAEHTLAVWDEHLVRAGSELLHARTTLVAELDGLVRASYESLAPQAGEPSLRYDSSVLRDAEGWGPGGQGTDGRGADSRGSEHETPDREGSDGLGMAGTGGLPGSATEWSELMLAALRRRRRDELDRGLCLVGPHRDDVSLMLRDLPARGYASQGESWTYALSLRLASFDIMRRELDGGTPVLILDDVLAELDEVRRRALATAVSAAEQVLVTAAVPEDVPADLDGPRLRVPEDVAVREPEGVVDA